MIDKEKSSARQLADKVIKNSQIIIKNGKQLMNTLSIPHDKYKAEIRAYNYSKHTKPAPVPIAYILIFPTQTDKKTIDELGLTILKHNIQNKTNTQLDIAYDETYSIYDDTKNETFNKEELDRIYNILLTALTHTNLVQTTIMSRATKAYWKQPINNAKDRETELRRDFNNSC